MFSVILQTFFCVLGVGDIASVRDDKFLLCKNEFLPFAFMLLEQRKDFVTLVANFRASH